MNSSGVVINGTWICVPPQNGIKSRGIFFGDSPFNYAAPVFLLQLSLAAVFTSCLQLFLTPFGESAFISQMLAGFIMGPSILGRSNLFVEMIFPPKSYYVNETFAFFGCMIYMFLVGVKMDLSMVKKSGRKAVAIGLSAFFLPILFNVIFALFLRRMTPSIEPNVHKSLFFTAVFLSSSSFHVIACLLGDLKLLNSEIGRLALSSSMISGIASWIWIIIAFTIIESTEKDHDNAFLWTLFCSAGLVIFIIFILRPIMHWMARRTPRGKPIKESYIVSIFLMVLTSALFGEITGQSFMLGPMVLGLAVPDGPPLGSALVDKLETYVSSIILPCYFLVSGSAINVSHIHVTTFGVVEMLAICSFCSKLIGTLIPASLYCKIPFVDALTLGLIMSTQGITDILVLQTGKFLKMVDEQTFTVMAISTVMLTGISTPIVKILYDPSKKYSALFRRRTLEHTSPDSELRLLACIYHQDNTPTIINLLKISNAKPQNPICLHVIHLMKLTGRSHPLFISHDQQRKKNSPHSSHSESIINAFKLYEEYNKEKVVVKSYTAIAPYATMHDEICMLAMEKRTSMVIIPFHKLWTASGVEESTKPLRAVNRHVLRTAPCSVGILVDRGTLSGTNCITSVDFYSIGVIFLEGADDREALAYASLMAEHPNVRVTLIRLLVPRRKSRVRINRDHDTFMIKRFKNANLRTKHHIYREELVDDSVEMINVIRSLENCFDLVLLGRRHEGDSPLFIGLNEWNEFPELGFLGDMLVSSDSNLEASVLVVQQQQQLVTDDLPGESLKFLSLEDSFPTSIHHGPSFTLYNSSLGRSELDR